MESITFERDLVNRCLGHDRNAQNQLYLAYCKAMYNVCYRMVNDHGVAEDVLQNAFIDVFSKMHLYSFQSSLGSWIKRVVINTCIDHLRKKKRYFDEIDERIMEVEDEIVQESSINVQSIHKAMEMLPDGYRTVFSLYAIEGYDHEEIGQVLGISEETSKSQYHRAKKKLKEIINQQGFKIIEN